jgi:hypothetical protein
MVSIYDCKSEGRNPYELLLVYAEKHGRRRYVYDIQRQKPL